MAELLLFGAARAELVSTVIGPHLQAGGIVVSDRFADSTVAYQQYGRMLPAEHVEAAIRLATGGLTPDITFLLDLPPNRQQRRAGQAQMGLDLGEAQRRAEADDGTQARFERESQEFHRRVRVGYRALAQKEPGRWSVLDAAASIQDVHALVLALTKPLLPAPPAVHSPLRDLTDLSDAG
jgi:dTMP kinase